jgi:hypothetical protein
MTRPPAGTHYKPDGVVKKNFCIVLAYEHEHAQSTAASPDGDSGVVGNPDEPKPSEAAEVKATNVPPYVFAFLGTWVEKTDS